MKESKMTKVVERASQSYLKALENFKKGNKKQLPFMIKKVK